MMFDLTQQCQWELWNKWNIPAGVACRMLCWTWFAESQFWCRLSSQPPQLEFYVGELVLPGCWSEGQIMKKYKIFVLTAISLVFLIFCFNAPQYTDSTSEWVKTEIRPCQSKQRIFLRLKYFPSLDVDVGGGENPLDGCTFVYLDMGTNIGVQIR